MIHEMIGFKNEEIVANKQNKTLWHIVFGKLSCCVYL